MHPLRTRAAAVPFILITILIDMLGIGLVIPVLPRLVIEMYGGPVAAERIPAAPVGDEMPLVVDVRPLKSEGSRGEAQDLAQAAESSQGAWLYGCFVASYALMQFLFAPILGNLSDAYGRRPVLLISLLGSAIDYVLLAFAPNLFWLFVGRIISGITGANITAANAYIADVSTPENRARNFGLVGACFGLGFIIGPAVGGLLGDYGLRYPFIAAAILTGLNWLYGCFVLPESHRLETGAHLFGHV